MPNDNSVTVSVVIKALNEEAHIEQAVRSALDAVARTGGEVILADSKSSDRTVDIARRFPIRIVQLKNADDRRCGVGPQLGYQSAHGEFVYILDGDMELDADFLVAAVAAMRKDPRLGGVGGLVEEKSTASYQFRGRKRRKHEGQAGEFKWLDMGGLYRGEALRDVGYFSNRNLHAFEEQELGLRLTSRNWTLHRLPMRSVVHHGYTEDTWTLLKRRWRSRYLDGTGEILRASLGKPFFWTALYQQKHLLIALTIWILALTGLLLLPVTPWVLALALLPLLALIAVRAVRSRSLVDAILGQVVWQVTSIAMVRGFLTHQIDPLTPVEETQISTVER